MTALLSGGGWRLTRPTGRIGAGIALTGSGVEAVRDFVGWRLAPYPTYGGGLGAGIALTGCGVEAIRDFVGWRLAPYPTYGADWGPELL